jgi:hypothetical protein
MKCFGSCRSGSVVLPPYTFFQNSIPICARAPNSRIPGELTYAGIMIGRLNALHENERAEALGRLVASLDRKRPGARQPRRRREPRAEAFSIRRLEGSRWRLRRRGSVPSGAVRSPVTAFIYLKIKSFPIAAETACSIMGSGDMSSHKPDRPSGRDAAPALSKNTKRTQSHFRALPARLSHSPSTLPHPAASNKL